MKINQEEAENLLNMLNSSDVDNAYIAFKAIDAHKFTGSDFGYLIFFYKFSKKSFTDWSTEAPKAFKRLSEYTNANVPLSFATGLHRMIELKSKKEAVELYLKYHLKDLKNMLNSMGYPMEHLELNLNIKKNE